MAEDLIVSLADTGFTVKQPDRLTATYFDGSPAPSRMEGTVAVPIGERKVTLSPDRILDGNQFPSGGAGMAATAKDVLAFLEAIRKGGGPILGAATAETMMQDQTGRQAETQGGPGWAFGYGGPYSSTPRSPARRSRRLRYNGAFEGMWGQFTRDVRSAVYARP